MKPLLTLLSLVAVAMGHAGPRSSASYSVITDIADGGGKRVSSVSFTNDGSLGGIAGVSITAAPVATAKQGYIAQLYEVTALQLTASPATVNELGTRQISGTQLLDDLTTIAVTPGSISWSILSGPLSSVSAGGLVTAGAVYQDASASVQGVFAGMTGSVNLTVLNTIADNFGSYGGDGIGDDWQVQYFGLNHPSAGPLLDPDGDGLNNLVEYGALLNPTLSGIIPTQTVKNGGVLEFSYPRSVSAFNQGLNFIVEWSDTLNTNDWHTTSVTQQVLSDNGTVQQVKATVPDGGSGHRFVRLKVTSPP